MRYLKLVIGIVFFLSIQSCNLFKHKAKIKVVNDYINDILNSNKPEVTSLHYLDLNESYFSDVEDSVFFHGFYIVHVNQLKELIIDMNNGKYEIVTKENVKYENLIKNYNLQIKGGRSVYYLVAGDEIFTSFIVEGGKIISFVPKLNIGGNSKKDPWFINIPYEY